MTNKTMVYMHKKIRVNESRKIMANMFRKKLLIFLGQ
jgi:hypothetical protein